MSPEQKLRAAATESMQETRENAFSGPLRAWALCWAAAEQLPHKCAGALRRDLSGAEGHGDIIAPWSLSRRRRIAPAFRSGPETCGQK